MEILSGQGNCFSKGNKKLRNIFLKNGSDFFSHGFISLCLTAIDIKHKKMCIRDRAGTFGYELDPAKLTSEEKAEIREQIIRFKEYYELIQTGDYFRLTSPDTERYYSAWEFAALDKKEALVSVVASRVRANDQPARVLLRGLQENGIYLCDGKEYTGGALMYAGLSLIHI